MARRTGRWASRRSAARSSSGDALVTAAIEGAEATNGFVEAPTAQPLRGAPPPGSLAAEEARAAVEAEEEAAPAEATVVQPGDGREGGF